MSVYVGIDVHRKRSQVAVIDTDGEVLANRNVPNGADAILGVIGRLPPGTLAAFGAAFGWGGWRGCWRTTTSPQSTPSAAATATGRSSCRPCTASAVNGS